jgi:hypothetical protein
MAIGHRTRWMRGDRERKSNMHRVLSLRPGPGLLVAFVALVLALGGVAVAKGGGSGSNGASHVIQACVQPAQPGVEGRELSLPIEGKCPQGDIPIALSEQGPKGERGPRGQRGAKGVTGRTGPVGQTGSVGLTGASGEKGATGAQGETGAAGNTVLHGEGPPSETEGAEGDFYIDTTAHEIYGPKTAGSWGGSQPTSLVGPQGATGQTGAAGQTGPTGPTGPTGAIGPEGPQGNPGISGYEVVRRSASQTVSNGGTVNVFPPLAECAGGKRLLGGGTSSNGGQLLASGPLVSEGTVFDDWESGVLFHNETGSTFTITVNAIAYCANVE